MSNATINLLNDITTIYSTYSNFFILIIGLFSNISLIFIFITLRKFRHNQCTFYLTVESAANIVLLFVDTSSPIYKTMFGIDPINVSLVWCKIQKAVAQQAGLFSLFTICCLTFDQYLATNPRSNWRQMSTLRLARRLTYCNILFNIAHSSLFIIFTDISPTVGCTAYNNVLSLYFSVFYFSILSTGIPLVVMVTFSLLAYRNVRRIIRRQIAVVRRRLDRQLTAMVLARVISLIVLGFPYVLYCIYIDQVFRILIILDYTQLLFISQVQSSIHSCCFCIE